MNAEIIAVGSEMLTPDHLDTNSLFITKKLNEAGFRIQLKSVIGDNADDIAAILLAALERSQLIIICGGLGPTEDDLTRTAVARALKRSLSVDPDVLEALRQRFARRGYGMSRINERQAQVIEGAETLENPVGTAPGMWLQEQGVGIALLPGPPRELKPMLETHVLPRIRGMGQARRMAGRTLHVTGMTESEVDSRIAPIYTAYPEVQTTVLANPGHIALRFYQWLNAEEHPSDLEEVAGKIQEALGDAVFSSAGETLEEVVGGLLGQSRRSLAVAESCTAGMLGMRLTRVAGSSAYFLGGVLCYSNAVKRDLCRVSGETLERCGAVSSEAAEELARGVRELLGSSIGLSITGIAGPGGGSEEKPVGLVYVGLSDGRRLVHARRILPGDREMVRQRATSLALALLRRFLLSDGWG